MYRSLLVVLSPEVFPRFTDRSGRSAFTEDVCLTYTSSRFWGCVYLKGVAPKQGNPEVPGVTPREQSWHFDNPRMPAELRSLLDEHKPDWVQPHELLMSEHENEDS